MNQYGTFNESYKSPYDREKNQQEKSYVFDIQDKESFEAILKIFPIVVVDVWAAYCNPCRMMAPKYENVANAFRRKHEQRMIIFLKDDIEQHSDIHKPLVSVVPTFFMYVNGKRYHVPDFRELEVTVEAALTDIMSQLNARMQSENKSPESSV